MVTDDGVAQKLTLEQDTGREPLALVVVVEVGGAGARQFQNYSSIAPPLAPMLASIVGDVPHKVSVVTFDSHPTLLQRFTSDTEEATAALMTLRPGCTRQHHMEDCEYPGAVQDVPLGDNGAAILDSLEYAVGLLRSQPIGYRRAILLISETLDRGSETTVEQAVRDITDTNTTIYGIGFSTAKSESAHYAARQLPTQPSGRPSGILSLEEHHPNPPHGCMGKDPHPDSDGATIARRRPMIAWRARAPAHIRQNGGHCYGRRPAPQYPRNRLHMPTASATILMSGCSGEHFLRGLRAQGIDRSSGTPVMATILPLPLRCLTSHSAVTRPASS